MTSLALACKLNAVNAPRSRVAKMIAALRRLGGMLIYEPDNLAGVYVDNVGTTPVTAVADLIGLITDKSYGGQLGVDRQQDFVTGVGGTATAATYDPVTGIGTANRVDLSNQSFVRITGLTAAKSYRLTITNTGAVALNVRQLDYAGSIVTTVAAGTSGECVFTGNADCVITSAGGSCAFTLTSFKEVPGNHATQSAVASKPSFQRVPKRLGPEMIASQDLTTWTSGGAFGNWSGSTATSTTVTATGANGSRYVRLPCTPGKTYTFASLVTAVTGIGAVAIAYGTSANAYISETTSTFVTAGPLRVTSVAPANAAFVEFAVRVGATGTTSTFTALTAGEVLEWANVISFDGNNDFLQTGITTGNEGWVCAGVTVTNHTSNQTIFGNGAGGATLKGVWMAKGTGASTYTLNLSDGTGGLRDALSSPTVPVNTPCVIGAGWNASTMMTSVDLVETQQAKTKNPTHTAGIALGGLYSFFHNGNANAFVICSVYPSAADRAAIINGIAALQGRTL